MVLNIGVNDQFTSLVAKIDLVGTPLGKIVGKMAEKDKKMQREKSEKKGKNINCDLFSWLMLSQKWCNWSLKSEPNNEDVRTTGDAYGERLQPAILRARKLPSGHPR